MGSYKYGHNIGRVTIMIADIRGLITPLITTHEPPSAHDRGSHSQL